MGELRDCISVIRTFTLATGFSLGLTLSAYATDRFVSESGIDSANDCTSSAAPCVTITNALAAAVDGDVVKIAAGTYTDEIVIVGRSVKLSGGWSPDFSAQDRLRFLTTLDRQEQGRLVVIVAAGGTPADVTLESLVLTRASEHAVEAIAEGSSSLVLTIQDCVITKNRTRFSYYGGGGISLSSRGAGSLVHAKLVSTELTNNASGWGGAVSSRAFDGGALDIEIEKCRLASNRATGAGGGSRSRGGAIYVDIDRRGNPNGGVATLTITDSILENNPARGGEYGAYGGAIYLYGFHGDVSAVIERSTLRKNRADEGGAVYSDGASVSVSDSNLSNNLARGWGGAYGASYGGLTLRNTLISRNRARKEAGGLSLGAVDGVIFNCTLTANMTSGLAGGLWSRNGSLDLTNTILWGNKTKGGADHRAAGGTVDQAYTDIGVQLNEGATLNDLGGNVSTDPQFRAFDDLQFHLSEGSPCVDTGTCAGAPLTDFEGDDRPSGASCDMGYDEVVQ